MLVCMEALGDITARFVAKLIADRVEQEKPASPDREAEGGGSALPGMHRRNRNTPRIAAAQAGEDRVPHPGRENVIDYRDSAPLLEAWGRSPTPRHSGGRPQHLKRPASKTCRASRPRHDPR